MQAAMTEINATEMNEFKNAEADADGARDDISKTRLCLTCQNAFESQWSGERICPRCKGKSAWREGHVSDFISMGGRR